MFYRIRLALQEPSSPLEPPVRDRLLAAERRRIPGEPDRHPRRSQAIVALTIDAMRAFTDIEHDIGQVEPPGGEPQTFECFGGFLGLQGHFEGEAGRLPIATTERRPAGIETIDTIEAIEGSDRRGACAAGVLGFHDGLRGTDYQYDGTGDRNDQRRARRESSATITRAARSDRGG